MSQFAMNSDEHATVQRAAGGDVTVSGVARLYKSGGPSWGYTGSWGAAALVADKGTHFIRLITLYDGQVVFEQELYENFEFAGPTAFFVTFEGNDAVYGLSFADPHDAGAFLQGLSTTNVSAGGDASGPPLHHASSLPVLPTRRPSQPMPAGSGGNPPMPSRPPMPTSPSAPVMSTSPPPATQPAYSVPAASTPSTPTRAPPATVTSPPPSAAGMGSGIKGGSSVQKKGGKSSGFGGWMKKMTASFTGPDADEVVLSGPTGFRHESHIGWDETNGFEIRNIPPEWRKLFQAAGVKKSELQDGATAKFIMETVAEAAMGMGPPGTPGSPRGAGASAPAAPPPPSFAPAPAAPPPMMGAPAPGAPPPPMPTGASSSSTGGLLAGLQSVHLKTAAAGGGGDGGLPDLKNMNEEQATNLASTLQKAMAARRPALEAESDDEILSEDEWSS